MGVICEWAQHADPFRTEAGDLATWAYFVPDSLVQGRADSGSEPFPNTVALTIPRSFEHRLFLGVLACATRRMDSNTGALVERLEVLDEFRSVRGFFKRDMRNPLYGNGRVPYRDLWYSSSVAAWVNAGGSLHQGNGVTGRPGRTHCTVAPQQEPSGYT